MDIFSQSKSHKTLNSTLISASKIMQKKIIKKYLFIIFNQNDETNEKNCYVKELIASNKNFIGILRTKKKNQTRSSCTRVYAKKAENFGNHFKSFATFNFSAPPHKCIINRAAYITVNMNDTFTLNRIRK